MGAEFHQRLAAKLEAFGTVSRQLSEFLHENAVPHETVFAVELALEEIITNTIKYGFDDDPGGHQITVEAATRSGRVTLVITDDGREFDPLAAAPPDFSVPAEQRGIGGLGLHLVRCMMDSVEYTRLDGRNVLTAVKHFGGAA